MSSDALKGASLAFSKNSRRTDEHPSPSAIDRRKEWADHEALVAATSTAEKAQARSREQSQNRHGSHVVHGNHGVFSHDRGQQQLHLAQHQQPGYFSAQSTGSSVLNAGLLPPHSRPNLDSKRSPSLIAATLAASRTASPNPSFSLGAAVDATPVAPTRKLITSFEKGVVEDRTKIHPPRFGKREEWVSRGSDYSADSEDSEDGVPPPRALPGLAPVDVHSTRFVKGVNNGPGGRRWGSEEEDLEEEEDEELDEMNALSRTSTIKAKSGQNWVSGRADDADEDEDEEMGPLSRASTIKASTWSLSKEAERAKPPSIEELVGEAVNAAKAPRVTTSAEKQRSAFSAYELSSQPQKMTPPKLEKLRSRRTGNPDSQHVVAGNSAPKPEPKPKPKPKVVVDQQPRGQQGELGENLARKTGPLNGDGRRGFEPATPLAKNTPNKPIPPTRDIASKPVTLLKNSPSKPVTPLRKLEDPNPTASAESYKYKPKVQAQSQASSPSTRIPPSTPEILSPRPRRLIQPALEAATSPRINLQAPKQPLNSPGVADPEKKRTPKKVQRPPTPPQPRSVTKTNTSQSIAQDTATSRSTPSRIPPQKSGDSSSSNDSFVSASSTQSPSRSPTSAPTSSRRIPDRKLSLASAPGSPSRTPASYHHAHRRSTSVISTGNLMLSDMTDAIVAGAIASSRLTPHNTGSTMPPPALPPRAKSPRLRQTMRNQEEPVEDEPDRHKKGHLHRLNKGKHSHHEGSRKKWREEMTPRERKRYDALWQSNRGDLILQSQSQSQSTSQGEKKSQPLILARDATSEYVSNMVVRQVWKRSRLPDDELAEVWDAVDREKVGALQRAEFVVGLWLIDQRLKGRKIPQKVGQSVWASADGRAMMKGVKKK